MEEWSTASPPAPAYTDNDIIDGPMRRNHHVAEFPEEPQRCKRNKLFTLGGSIVMVVVIGLAVSQSAAKNKRGNSNETVVGTSKNDMQQRYNTLFAKLLQFDVVNATFLQDETTPSSQALNWLAFEDTGTLVHDSDLVRTRFALATLYFSTYKNASAWISSELWLSPVSVCWWHGIDCAEDDSDQNNNMGRVVTGIHLGDNLLAGTIPRELAMLQGDLHRLDLSHNAIYGRIPKELGMYLTNLRKLYLGPNKLSRAIPKSVFDLKHLTHLYLDSCQLSGSIPDSIGTMLPNLQGLDMHNNYLTGSIPPSIGKLTKLRVLNLDVNAISGAIPSTLGKLTGLVDLRLSSNRLRGTIPKVLDDLHMLEVFYLFDNQLTGSVGDIDFEDMPLLGDVQLHNNRINGTIPDSLGSLALLQVLYLDRNELTGDIPSALGNNLLLESMYLSNNRLTGSIPKTIGNLENLKHLHVEQNHLSGPIPSTLGGLLKLETLFLNNNTLRDTVPSQLGQLPNLKDARFHGNTAITGRIPFDCDKSSKLELSADCKLECACCTICYT